VARSSGIYWFALLGLTMLLVYVLSVAISTAAGIPWFEAVGTVGAMLPLAAVWLVCGAYQWVMRGGWGPTVVGAVMVPLHKIAFALPMPIHNGTCRLRAAIGPGRDLFRGIIDLREGRLEQSAAALERHLRRSPNEVAGLTCATLALAKRGCHDEALRLLDAAVVGKSRADALGLRALTLMSAGATEDALRDIDAAVALRPNNPIYHFWRAQVLVVSGSIDEALDALRREAQPVKCPFNWWTLSFALQAKGDAAAAADASSRAVPIMAIGRLTGLAPWDETPEAVILARMGKLDGADRAIARTLTKYPSHQEALSVQALVHTRRGETEDALRTLEEASRWNPFQVVDAARDPFFAPLVAGPGFAALLTRATSEWEARLLAIRSRPGIAQSGA
jgi:tetratricopeptide (TPR) repeat protein